MSLRVSFDGADDRVGVLVVSEESDGTLVLRFSTHNERIEPDEYESFTIAEELA